MNKAVRTTAHVHSLILNARFRHCSVLTRCAVTCRCFLNGCCALDSRNVPSQYYQPGPYCAVLCGRSCSNLWLLRNANALYSLYFHLHFHRIFFLSNAFPSLHDWLNLESLNFLSIIYNIAVSTSEKYTPSLKLNPFNGCSFTKPTYAHLIYVTMLFLLSPTCFGVNKKTLFLCALDIYMLGL